MAFVILFSSTSRLNNTLLDATLFMKYLSLWYPNLLLTRCLILLTLLSFLLPHPLLPTSSGFTLCFSFPSYFSFGDGCSSSFSFVLFLARFRTLTYTPDFSLFSFDNLLLLMVIKSTVIGCVSIWPMMMGCSVHPIIIFSFNSLRKKDR